MKAIVTGALMAMAISTATTADDVGPEMAYLYSANRALPGVNGSNDHLVDQGFCLGVVAALAFRKSNLQCLDIPKAVTNGQLV